MTAQLKEQVEGLWHCDDCGWEGGTGMLASRWRCPVCYGFNVRLIRTTNPSGDPIPELPQTAPVESEKVQDDLTEQAPAEKTEPSGRPPEIWRKCGICGWWGFDGHTVTPRHECPVCNSDTEESKPAPGGKEVIPDNRTGKGGPDWKPNVTKVSPKMTEGIVKLDKQSKTIMEQNVRLQKAFYENVSDVETKPIGASCARCGWVGGSSHVERKSCPNCGAGVSPIR